MSLVSNLLLYVNRVATEFRNIRSLITGSPTGDLTGLQTTAKTDVVSAINELKVLADGLSASGQTAAQVQAAIDAAITSLLDGAPNALDTLNELAAALGDDPNFATSIATQLAAKANSADVWTKTEVGDVTTDFVAAFENTLNAP